MVCERGNGTARLLRASRGTLNAVFESQIIRAVKSFGTQNNNGNLMTLCTLELYIRLQQGTMKARGLIRRTRSEIFLKIGVIALEDSSRAGVQL
jgi:hypothetical protein